MGGHGPTARIAALDGIRAIAVLSVFAYHALAFEPDFSGLRALQLGRFGVTVFFVLSGFLITSRLLSLEARRDLGAGARWRSFFVRRIARIFPLYYATVAVVLLLGTSRAWPWLVTYSLNVGIARSLLEHGRWIGPGHLWSLCVEEQFYLLFPLLVLTRLRRWVAPIVGAAAVGAVALRIAVAMTGNPWAMTAVWMLPPAHFDALGAGILAALAAGSGDDRVRRWVAGFHETGPLLGALATIGLGVAATRSPWAHVIGLQDQAGMVWAAVFPTALSATSAAAILAAWRGEFGAVGRVLGSRPLVALGRISYAVYVFHLLILTYFTHHAWLPTHPLTRALLALGATIALAAASWRVLERPLIEQGRRLAEALELRSQREATTRGAEHLEPAPLPPATPR